MIELSLPDDWKPTAPFSLFFHQQNIYGAAARGLILVPSFKACDPLLDAADDMMSRWTKPIIRERHEHPVALWSFPDLADSNNVLGGGLYLDHIPDDDAAYYHAGRTFTYLFIQDPNSFSNPKLLWWFRSLMRSSEGVSPVIFTTGSKMVDPYAAQADQSTCAIDYSAITKSVSS